MRPSDFPVPLPAPGQAVPTACGGRVEFHPDTPYTFFKGRRIFFCLPACQHDFELDPHSSCLAEDTLPHE